MFFVKLARILAWILVVISSLRIAMGFFVAFSTSDMASNAALSRSYLGTATSGEAINSGFIWLLVGIALGVIAKLGSSKNESSDGK